MATREKKARSVTADSPTPSLGSANSGSSGNISTLAVSSTSSINSTTAAASGNDSTPTTPTSGRKGAAAAAATGTTNTPAGGGSGGSGSSSTSTTRGSLSRLKSKQQLLQQGDETAVEETSVDSIATTPSRTTRGGSALLREDSAGRDSPAGKDKEDGIITSTASGTGAGTSKDVTKSPAVGARRATSSTTSKLTAVPAEASKKSRVVTLKRTGLLKRKGKKVIGKPMLGRKVVARRQLVTTAKSTGTKGAAATVKEVLAVPTKEEEPPSDRTATPSLRNGKPRNSDSPVAKRKSAVAKKEEIFSSKSPDSGLMERRRSGSVSKCSDLMEEGAADQTVADMKRELLDFESRNKMLDKMAEAFNERKAAGGGAASPNVEKGQSSGGTLRRSMRQRKSTTREKEEFLPPRGKSTSSLDIKMEPAESLESLSADGELPESSGGVSVDAPLTIDTTEAGDGVEPLLSDGTATSLGGMSSGSAGGGVSVATGAAAGEEELVVGKDPSLSPGEMVSEGVSEQSVKECYGEPAFLENNLGIEKDPKLGEIVQERFRYDKVSDDVDNAKEDASVGGSSGDAASDNGGGGAGVTNDSVMVEEQEKYTAEAEEEGMQEEVSKVKQKEQRNTGVEEEDQGITIEFVKVEDTRDDYEQVEPMDEDSGVTTGEVEEEIGKEVLSEEEKMDIAEGEEFESVKIKDEPEVSESGEKTADDTPPKTDDGLGLKKESNRSKSATPVEDDVDGNGQTSKPSSSGVATGDDELTTNNVQVGDASGSVTVAAVAGKTNGESNGSLAATASPAGEQSILNQQPSRGGAPQKGNGTMPKTAKLSPLTVTGGKEARSKTRTTKEKSKEDEKTREEKLRQEKLRVEEKVREEKQRAERLEAEKRLKKEQLLQQKVLENGLEEQARSASRSSSSGTKSGGSSPATSQTAEQENKTETTTPPLHVLSGLNLSAITIALTRKDSGGSSSSDEKEQPTTSQKPKAELEILPIKGDGTVSPPAAVGLLSKEEKPAKEGGASAPSLADTAESRLRTKSENAAAAVSVQEKRKDGSNKSLLKIESSNGSPVVGAAAEERKTITLDESDDAAKRKESHLKHLGLLTIRAAVEEKQRRAEQQKPTMVDALQDGAGGSAPGGSGTGKGGQGWLSAGTNQSSGTGTGGRTGNKSTRSSKDEYTVSMKTSVPKGGSGGGSRGEKRKQQRIPLKMTFQKGKGKGSVGRDSTNGSGSASSNGSGYATDTGNNGDNTFYTVHSNELDHHSSNSSDGHSHRGSGATGGRKGHSRSHTTDGVNVTEAVGESVSTKESVSQESLVIPEKASSFNVHPERLCRDQCSYCGGRFGLYDTPCHVAQIKSTERQQRILLATLPKITLDSCLCDACFRHVDRKANCPPQQKKKSSTVQQTASSSGVSNTTSTTTTTTTQSTVSPLVLKVTTNRDGSTSIATEQPATADDGPTAGGKAREICAVRQCTAHAMQSLRRKWMLRMKRKIGKHLDINLEQAAKSTAEYISICNKHYEQISHLMICAMCTKPVQRNQVYHLFNNIQQLERLIQEQGIAVRLSSSELVVCKCCKFYANLLIRPPEPEGKGAQFLKDYNRRLRTARQEVAREQRKAREQREQQVEATVVVAPEPEAPKQLPQPPVVTDIVISDGDEEDDVVENEEVEESAVESPIQQVVPAPRYQTLEDIFSIGNSSVSLRRRVASRQSSDVTIVESNGPAQMNELEEISIIPTSKTLSAMNQQQQQQQSRDDNIDMTKVLKSNPNISMRELFPGEEELGVSVNIPFSSSSVRTPGGWTKVTSTIQYDDSTRALWEELQKPYGNQSSFLRHLILLEKYFRNGDLILSPQAKNNATTYSEAVQNRLRSYDNVPSVVPSSPPALASLTPVSPPGAVDKTSNIFQQFSSATITIVPANKVRPKTGSNSSSSSSALFGGSNAPEITPVSPPAPVSLLKSNNLHLAISEATKTSLKRKLSIDAAGRTSGGANISFGASSSITSPLNSSSGGSTSSASKVVKLDEPKAPLSSPPELISISNRKPSVTITSIPPGQQVATGASVGPLAAAAGTTPKQLSLLNQSQQSLLQTATPTTTAPAVLAKKSPAATATANTAAAATATGPSSNATGNAAAREIIQMPEQLTEAERRESSSRPWRPTLLPIAPGVTESLKTGPLYQTADGRTLPKLVQVMSGGKPYHISIEDYNRMCILRREKLLQQQHNMIQQTAANKRLSLPNKPPAASNPPPALRLSTSAVENSGLINNAANVAAGGGTKVVQFPNQLLEQNSLIPILSGSGGGGGNANKIGTGSNALKNCSSSLTVTMTTTTVNNNSLAKSGTSILPPMKPLTLPNSTSVYPMMMPPTISLPPSLFSVTSGSSSLPSSSTAGLFTSGGGVTTQASSLTNRPSAATSSSLVLGQPTSLLNPANSTASTVAAFEHLLKDGNKVTQAQLQEFVAIATAANGGGLGASSSSLLDNSSPSQLLSKIPKSLTVIPQQKQRSMSRVSSHEDQNSA